MRTWFNVASVIGVPLPRDRSLAIADIMRVAAERLNFRSDGRWLSALPDFKQRYGGTFFMITVVVVDDIDTIKKRYQLKGNTNFTLRVPFQLIESLNDLAMAALFEEQFIACCEDAAQRWGTTIHWRVDPGLRSPT